MKIHIEIRPGEGGDDARMLVREQARIYTAYAENKGLAVEVTEEARASAG